MPFTPYHFGPSGFVGLVFRKWLDIPVFVLANVAIDIEVLVIALFNLGWPPHRYCHTLLFGAAVGVLWGVVAYPFRHLFGKVMQILRIPYKTGFWKMVISGLLGAWFHIIIDAFYHWDVLPFWPSRVKPLYRLMSRGQVKLLCLAFFIAAAIVYGFTVVSYNRKNKLKRKATT